MLRSDNHPERTCLFAVPPAALDSKPSEREKHDSLCGVYSQYAEDTTRVADMESSVWKFLASRPMCEDCLAAFLQRTQPPRAVLPDRVVTSDDKTLHTHDLAAMAGGAAATPLPSIGDVTRVVAAGTDQSLEASRSAGEVLYRALEEAVDDDGSPVLAWTVVENGDPRVRASVRCTDNRVRAADPVHIDAEDVEDGALAWPPSDCSGKCAVCAGVPPDALPRDS